MWINDIFENVWCNRTLSEIFDKMQNKEEEKPFPWNDCILKISFFLQFLAFVLCGIAFFSPFWYIELNTDIRAGLWGRCDRLLECIWFAERSFQQSLPGEFGYTCNYHIGPHRAVGRPTTKHRKGPQGTVKSHKWLPWSGNRKGSHVSISVLNIILWYYWKVFVFYLLHT